MKGIILVMGLGGVGCRQNIGGQHGKSNMKIKVQKWKALTYMTNIAIWLENRKYRKLDCSKILH